MDTYDLRVRLSPALLVALPPALSLVPVLDGLSLLWAGVAPVLVTCGGTYLLAQLARDAGKRIEPELYRSWGGTPTTQLLRHRGPAPQVAVAHRHAHLRRVLPQLPLPTPDQEAADPEAADHAYETAVLALRERTRNRQQHTLVFEENCSYGFRRNLLGLRAYGIVGAVVGLGLAAGSLVAEGQLGAGFSLSFVGAFLLDVVALGLWAFRVTSAWVEPYAHAYAERLLGAAEQL